MTEPNRQKLQTDVIVLGAGAVGENVAGRLVQAGLKAVLVEAELVGGECSYWACMPSKALIRPATALHAARSVAGSREAATGSIDAGAVLNRRDSFTAGWDDAGQVEWVSDAGIELIRGRARLSGERQVSVVDGDDDDGGGAVTVIDASTAVVLATGSTPSTPPIGGLADVPFWGTREATAAKAIPGSLAVIGGGVAGTELAQAFARLGSTVTMIVRGQLLDAYPAPAVKLVSEALAGSGIDVRTGTEARRVTAVENGIELMLTDGSSVRAEQLLVSTGRHPALANLGLEELGVQPKELSTDASGRVAGVTGGWLYAVGDAAGKVALTHQGKYEARATADAIAARAAGTLGVETEAWSRYAATADEAAVPQVVFTDPEIAMVGLTEAQARGKGLNIRSVELPLEVAGSKLYADDYQGWAQMVVDEDRRVVLGMTFAGPGVAEMLHAATIAVVGQVPLERLWHAVPAYPTISEVWLRLLEKYGL